MPELIRAAYVSSRCFFYFKADYAFRVPQDSLDNLDFKNLNFPKIFQELVSIRLKRNTTDSFIFLYRILDLVRPKIVSNTQPASHVKSLLYIKYCLFKRQHNIYHVIKHTGYFSLSIKLHLHRSSYVFFSLPHYLPPLFSQVGVTFISCCRQSIDPSYICHPPVLAEDHI